MARGLFVALILEKYANSFVIDNTKVHYFTFNVSCQKMQNNRAMSKKIQHIGKLFFVTL